MPEGIRFRPPPIELTPEIRWVLLRALGPLDLGFGKTFDTRQAASVAHRLGVAARVAARLGRDAVVDALGEDAARPLEARVRAVGAELAHDHTIGRLAAVSRATSIPIVILKSQAIRAAGRAVEGGRMACDVDLLVARDRAATYQQALVDGGFIGSEDKTYEGTEQHLPALSDPEGSIAEVHTKLLGVTMGRGTSVGFDALEAAGLLEPLPATGPGCFVPATDVSAAYALVHGIAQHGRRPDSYALLWVIADLIDLGFDGEPGETERLLPLVERSLSHSEVSASLELAGELGRGGLVDGWGALHARPRRLLEHILASRLDTAYLEDSLLRVFHGSLSDRPKAAVIAGDLFRSVFPSGATLAAEYGPTGPVGRVGQWGRWVGKRIGRLTRALTRRR